MKFPQTSKSKVSSRLINHKLRYPSLDLAVVIHFSGMAQSVVTLLCYKQPIWYFYPTEPFLPQLTVFTLTEDFQNEHCVPDGPLTTTWPGIGPRSRRTSCCCTWWACPRRCWGCSWCRCCNSPPGFSASQGHCGSGAWWSPLGGPNWAKHPPHNIPPHKYYKSFKWKGLQEGGKRQANRRLYVTELNQSD